MGEGTAVKMYAGLLNEIRKRGAVAKNKESTRKRKYRIYS